MPHCWDAYADSLDYLVFRAAVMDGSGSQVKSVLPATDTARHVIVSNGGSGMMQSAIAALVKGSALRYWRIGEPASQLCRTGLSLLRIALI